MIIKRDKDSKKTTKRKVHTNREDMITTGGSRPTKYRHQVRIGNWSEEWELEKTRWD